MVFIPLNGCDGFGQNPQIDDLSKLHKKKKDVHGNYQICEYKAQTRNFHTVY